ncbi:MAG: ETC complex I subunit [Azospirillaceae bacterium]
MRARIYQPSKTAMQSGRGKSDHWLLEYEPETPRRPEPLMGWISSGDTLNQIHIRFDTREEAETFARRRNIDYVVEMPHQRRVVPRNYADNFKPRPQ